MIQSHFTKIQKIKNKFSKFNNKEIDHVLQALNSENKIDFVSKLEKSFSKLYKVKYSIACNSGTSGLHAALFSLNLKKNDEVIIPALTVVMDAYAAIHLGCRPVFADVDKDSFLVTAKTIEKKINKKTKAIILVSLQGLPVDINPIKKLAKKYNLKIIEDNAQDFLGKYNKQLSGTIGDVGIWSFENKKHLSGCSEGGIIGTNNKELAIKIRKFAGIGYRHMSATAGRTSLSISAVQDPNYERFDTIGLNYRMAQIVAAVCLGQLQSVKKIVDKRRKSAQYFREAIKECNWLIEQKIPKNTIHSHYTFSVRYKGDKYLNLSWKNFYKKYVSMGGDGFYSACINPYLEPSLKGYYKEFKKGLCPTAESLQKEIMQFKTNYRNLVDAKKKAKILKKLILQLNNLEK